MADGSLITKDLRLEGQGGTTVSRLDPDSLDLIGEPLRLPEGSMGRIATEVTADGTETIYVPGTEHLWRLVVDGDRWSVDDRWQPRYRAVAPPVHIPEAEMAVAWDSINGGLAGVSTAGGGLEVAWHLDVRASMQPVVFPASGELVINDFTADGSDDLIVVDVASGELLDRVPTGSRIANGMFLSAGGRRDVWYCSTLTLARVAWS